jgi:hypothetical protein
LRFGKGPAFAFKQPKYQAFFIAVFPITKKKGGQDLSC